MASATGHLIDAADRVRHGHDDLVALIQGEERPGGIRITVLIERIQREAKKCVGWSQGLHRVKEKVGKRVPKQMVSLDSSSWKLKSS